MNQTPAGIHETQTFGAPLWRRFMALLYDSFLLGALIMLYGAITTFVLFMVRGDTSEGEYQPMVQGAFENALFLLGLVLTLSVFYVFFWWRAGQTVGMRAWRLKLVDSENSPIKLKWCVVRAFAGVPAFFLLGVGYWWRWFDRYGDCLQDRLSRSRVVVLAKGAAKQKR